MSYGYNNGWGGCGCGNTVQYAPPACNPNFPTACYALGAGTIQRVVGEDSAYCKYTVPTLSSNSILFYNASTGLVNWADGSVSNPIYLGSGNQATSTTVGAIQGTTPTGQLVEFNPATSTKAQIPVVAPSGTTTTWGTIESILPNQGIVYKTGATADGSLAANTVYQLTGTTNQFVSFDASGNPIASSVPASGVGINQTWNNFTSSRAINVNYVNTTSFPIAVIISGYMNNDASSVTLLINGANISFFAGGSANVCQQVITAIIPSGATYIAKPNASGVFTLTNWSELR